MSRILEKENIYEILKLSWGYLSPIRKRQLNYLFLLTIVNSFAELISISAIYPFLSFLVEPDLVKKYTFIQNIIKTFNITSDDQLLTLVTILYISSIIISAIIKIFFLIINI